MFLLTTTPSPTMAQPGKLPHRSILWMVLLGVVSCTTYEETRVAFDSIAGMNPSSLSEPKEASYSDKALMHGWATETFSFGSDGVLGVYETVFGSGRSESEVAAPEQFVRESLTTLVDLSGNDLEHLAESAYRVSFVLSKDPRGLSRSIATELAQRILRALGTGPVGPGAAGLTPAGAQTYLDEAKVLHRRLEPWWPGIRAAGPLSDGDRQAYLDTLTQLTGISAATSHQERLRLQLFLQLLRTDRQTDSIQEVLRDLLTRCVRSAMLRGLDERLEDADELVRSSAILQFWRLGGRDLFPWVLDRLEGQQPDSTEGLIDPSPDVRRRLVQCIWSFDLTTAQKRFGKASNPIEFLHATSIYDPERSLKFLATECLAHLLHRPNEIGSHWVHDWWDDYVTRAKTTPDKQD